MRHPATRIVYSIKAEKGYGEPNEHHHNHSWQIFHRQQQFSRLAPQTILYPAFSGRPNDWLSPTDRNLDAHGIG